MARPEDTTFVFEEAEYVPSNPRILVLRWWDGLDSYERVLYRGFAAVSLGLLVLSWPDAPPTIGLALIVPGAIVTLLAVLAFVLTIWRTDG